MVSKVNNQKSFWNSFHKKRIINKYSEHTTDFAKSVIKFFPKNAKVLDLGCGLANDSIFFAQNGAKVIATDFSKVVIEEAKGNHSNKNLDFKVLDIKNLSQYDNETFDVVYARLSLHYFTDLETRRIFNEIYRILKANGLIYFICKSTDDPLYGKGQRIEKDMFSYNNHIRHFFSEGYSKSLLEKSFKIKSIESGKENLYGHKSAFVEVVAIKN